MEAQSVNFEGCSFAELIDSSGCLIVEKWIDGVPLSKLKGAELERAISDVESMLRSMAFNPYSIKLAEKYPSAFCYFENYLLARLSLWSSHDEISTFVDGWKKDYGQLKQSIPIRLSHPDLSLDNIIQESGTGRLVIIDNELLGAGRGWILDWHNSLLRKLGRGRPSFFKDLPKDFVEKSWQLRVLGSALDSKDLSRINTAIDALG